MQCLLSNGFAKGVDLASAGTPWQVITTERNHESLCVCVSDQNDVEQDEEHGEFLRIKRDDTCCEYSKR